MPTVHPSIILTTPISLTDAVKLDPLVLDRPMGISEAADFCGITRESMASLRRRGQGPKFVRPNGIKRSFTTARRCLEWLNNTCDPKARRARTKIEEAANVK